MKTQWNPGQYEKFKDQRAKPFFDLMKLIEPQTFRSAIDLGCGTGELTRNLFDQLKPNTLLGIDSSPEMLERSKPFVTSGLSFELADIGHFLQDKKFDLIFSNAALQWLPDHEVLVPKILDCVNDEGQVAIQIPFNFDHPSHVLAADIAATMFPEVFPKTGARRVLRLERYAEILFANGFEKQIARIEVYGHPMSSGKEVLEWTKGTLLTGYQSKLSTTEFQNFLKAYESELEKETGKGPYFYAFKRALLWGKKNA